MGGQQVAQGLLVRGGRAELELQLLGPGVVAVQRVVGVGAEAAVQVLGGLYDPAYALRGPDLGDGDITRARQGTTGAAGRGIEPPGGLPQGDLHGAQVDVPVGGLDGDGLEGGHREAELFALAGVSAGHGEYVLAESERQRAGPGGEELAQPFPGSRGFDEVRPGHPHAVEGEFGEPLPARGDLLGEGQPVGVPRDEREDGLALAGVRGYGDPVRAVRPGDRGLRPFQDPCLALAAGDDGEFGRVVAGAPVGGGGEHERAAPRAGQQGGGQFGTAVGLYGHGRGAVLQQRDPRQHPGGLAQHQAQGDGVQARSPVLLGEDQAQQVRCGELGPQRAVEVVGDGPRGQRGAGHGVGRDIREDGPGRLDGGLLLLGEGEVHCLSSHTVGSDGVASDGASR